MNLKLVAIYDKRAQDYTPPTAYPTLGVAERNFTDAVNNPDSHLHKHPEDYSLMILGDYESTTGIVTPLNVPQHMMDATQVLQARN